MSDSTAPSGIDYVTKDSGQRVEFVTGSVRDLDAGKPDWTLLPLDALKRVTALYMRGAQKYERHNWRKGQSLLRAERSLMRHLFQYMNGERDEDHMAAVVFNACVILDHEGRIQSGELPASLDDRDDFRKVAAPAIVAGTDVMAWS